MLKGQDEFSEFVCTNLYSMIEEFSPDLLKNISPYMLYSILDYLHKKSDEITFKKNQPIIKLISDYLGLHPDITFSQSDRDLFEKLIDWDDPKMHLLFAKYNLDWAPPAKSLIFLGKLVSSRRTTIDSMKDQISVQSDVQCNPWNAISWISLINDSDGETNLHEIELVHFVGNRTQ